MVALLALPAVATGRPGDRDPLFGEGGRVATATEQTAPAWRGTGFGPYLRPSWLTNRVHVATAADGSIVVARGNALLRYQPDGRPDADFGEAGRLVISSVEGLPFGIADVAIDGEGRVLVFGTAVNPSVERTIPGYAISVVSPSFAVALRLNPTGELDPGFGGGDGVFRSALGLRPAAGVPTDIPLVEVASARLDPMGRAVMAIGKVGFPPAEGHTHAGWVVDALARLTQSGDLDSGFGGSDGFVEGIHGGWTTASSVVVDFCISVANRPVIASRQSISSEAAYEGRRASGRLLRLRADGAPDPSFGRGGIASARGGSGPLACPPSGRLLMLQGPDFLPAAEQPSSWRVVRRFPDGRVDRGFGRRAVVKLRGEYSDLTSLAVDRRGRALLAGTLRLPRRGGKTPRSFFTVIRLLPSGRLDRRFGHAGWIRTGFGRHATVSASKAAIDTSGRLLVAGYGRAPWLQPGGVVLARYLLGR